MKSLLVFLTVCTVAICTTSAFAQCDGGLCPRVNHSILRVEISADVADISTRPVVRVVERKHTTIVRVVAKRRK
jgi:hypothetical protein